MNKIISLLSIAFALFILVSCGKDNEEDLFPPDVNACDTTNVTYDNAIEAIINSTCATVGCHVSGSGIAIFESYAGVKEKVDNGSINNRTIVLGDMPPSGPLSECNMSLITAWINAGAPEN